MEEDDFEIPDDLIEEPELRADLQFGWDAFHRLSSGRPYFVSLAGGIAGEIPFTAIDSYAARYGVTDLDEFEELLFVIKALDRVYLEHVNRKPDG